MRIAITQAHVVVGTGIDDGVVVLDGDRLESVSAEESASDRSYDLTMDLEGRRAVIPGMIDAHIHMIGGDKSLGFDGEPLVMRTDLMATTRLSSRASQPRTTLRAGSHTGTHGRRARLRGRRPPSRR